ncbi:MAG TPA: FAD:protein FMN transferase [Spirochaetota bacterium]|nr:FAD:protein FMN transferase [Spirochaetota bacterium]HOM37813.1 FAD:protein FMN transferase [Spirochaetota bacterium]HPQ49310.1 FAD:protein FMN transferase [Spirochaetota bacterium]
MILIFRKRVLFLRTLIFIFPALIFFSGCKRYTTFSFPALGTIVTITLPSDNSTYNNYNKSREIVYNLQSVFNRYDQNSALTDFNDRVGNFKTLPEICDVINYSKFIYKITGVFDITVLPLLQIWDYKKGLIPTKGQIDNALKKLCINCINVIDNNKCIVEKKRDVKIDLGGISKGYIIKKLYEELSKEYNEGVINIGGDIFAFGKDWDVYITDPKSKKPRYKIRVKNKSVFTSGDYERFFFKNGRLYSHIIDPRTGEPAIVKYHSVTVIGDDPVISDGLATSFFILGPDDCYRIIKNYKNYSFMFIGDNGFIKSDNFPDVEEVK